MQHYKQRNIIFPDNDMKSLRNHQHWPPVTSHMASIAASSAEGMNVAWLSDAGGTAGTRSTTPNNLWSHRNGSLVNSLPGTALFIGKFN